MVQDKIGIGFIGTGFARKVQMPAFAACGGARLVSVSSGTKENAAAAASEFGIEHASGDWRETASHPDVDLIVITTPPIHHLEMAVAAIDAGKHILAEKPMAMNTAEAETMRDAAALRPIMALIDHELRFQPDGSLRSRCCVTEQSAGSAMLKLYFKHRTAAIRRFRGIGGPTRPKAVERWERSCRTSSTHFIGSLALILRRYHVNCIRT